MKQFQDNPTLQKRVLGYTAMASLAAAGAVSAGASAAQAAGTSRDINCHITTAGQICDIDFDNDGNVEIQFVRANASTVWMYMRSNSSDIGQSFVYSNLSSVAAVLPFNSTVSSARTDWNGFRTPGIHTNGGWGNWSAPKGHETDSTQGEYIGVSFDLAGSGRHYGWIELYIPTDGDLTVKRIGYDTTTGASIPTAVHLVDTQASSSPLRAAGAAMLTAVAGVLTWLRLRMGNDQDSGDGSPAPHA